jgi:hypothetical protein
MEEASWPGVMVASGSTEVASGAGADPLSTTPASGLGGTPGGSQTDTVPPRWSE